MIIDASVAFKWIVSEENSDAAIAWIGRGDLIAPVLIHAEVANALWKRVRRGELHEDDQIGGHLESLTQLVRTVDETPMLPRALDIAMQIAHPVYDCVYLAMAEELGDELLTADRRFIAAVIDTKYANAVKALGE